MAITDINISEQLQTDAPSIKYTGNEGPQNPQQQQQEMMIAQQIWEALDPEQQGQFQSFEQFYQSGIWKQILQQMQQDEAQGQGIAGLGPQTEEIEEVGIQSLRGGGRIGYDSGGVGTLMASAPEPMEMLDTMAMNEFGKLWKDLTNEEKDWLQEIGHQEGRAPVEKIGIMQAAKGGRIGFERGTDPALMKKAQFMAEILNISLDEAVARVISQSEGSFPRPEIRPSNYQEPLRRSLLGMRPPEQVEDIREEQIGIESLRGRP